MGKFAQQVRAMVDARKEDLRYVAAEAIQDVVEAAQTTQLGISRGATSFEIGKIPVDTADLVNSLVSSVDGAPVGAGATSYTAAIAGFEIGDTLQFAWTQEYALRIEHGFTGTDSLGRQYNQPGRHFVGKNASRFPEFVENRVRELRK